jgi:hypothetical protein
LNSGWFNAFSTVPRPTVFTTFLIRRYRSRAWCRTKQFLPLRGRALVRHRRMKPVTQWRWYHCRIRACYRLGQKDAVDIYSVASVVWTGTRKGIEVTRHELLLYITPYLVNTCHWTIT